ncbi:hypothetical protein [Fusibacter ferrireducens]|uniref:Uncharacterized protein n=1 Tax=Fusibacter ferrireducens TaxID=2785058 RepID=A0ABR9ZX01_9FIRM|nr:hypothetical protein [Fusibacter ferrireducens]MBF4694993.1 hypothetical protein [Fusibacter ferrireducens]
MKLYTPTLIFILNAIVTSVAYAVILFFNGAKQIKMLIRVFAIVLMLEPMALYYRFNSVQIALFSILIGAILMFFLFAIKEEMESEDL